MGASRSGSSLVEAALVHHVGAVALGETRWIFRRGCIDNETCGCGDCFHDCDFWTRHVDEAARRSASESDALRAEFDNPVKLFLGKFAPWMDRGRETRYNAYVDALGRVFRSIRSAHRATVDNSKRPYYAVVLADALKDRSDRCVYVHVVRNPIRVINSWSRIKYRTETRSREPMTSYPKPLAAIFWTIYIFSQLAMRIYFLRADHVFLSFDELQRTGVLKLDSAGRVTNVPLQDMSLDATKYHSVSGNPDRVGWKEGVTITPLETEVTRAGEMLWLIPLLPALLARQLLKVSCRSSLPMYSGDSPAS